VFDGRHPSTPHPSPKDEQHRPAVLRVQNVLQLRESLHTGLQRLFRAGLVFEGELADVAGIYVGQPEFFSVGHTIRFDNRLAASIASLVFMDVCGD
jgi:hypothetical protein